MFFDAYEKVGSESGEGVTVEDMMKAGAAFMAAM